ncbi:recombinase family protein [Azospirillum sp.]|uniref:recombinase family protein n=1 Tax=Azospirillum sp. TaxID=34012 RepID=UPI002D391BA2|nr:recombinase family protein [Azospirillum sp.]HYF86179.1 recombinase family protein [Azospirillum sp.]
MQCVGYIRVSTSKQGRSGLGLDAQQEAITRFSVVNGLVVTKFYRDVQSGVEDDRSGLNAAIAQAQREKCPLVVAKLDRLGRDVHFISGLMRHRVQFVVAELGLDVDSFTLHLWAALAEKERRMIADRTRQALLAKRDRGEPLGSPNIHEVAKAGVARLKAQADEHAFRTMPIIAEIRRAGVTTLSGIAAALNARGVRSARGGQWHPSTVRDCIHRSGKYSEGDGCHSC